MLDLSASKILSPTPAYAKGAKRRFTDMELLVHVEIDRSTDPPSILHYFYELLTVFEHKGVEWICVRVVCQDDEYLAHNMLVCTPRWFATERVICLRMEEDLKVSPSRIVSPFYPSVQYVDRLPDLRAATELDDRRALERHNCCWASLLPSPFAEGDRVVLVADIKDAVLCKVRYTFFMVHRRVSDYVLVLLRVARETIPQIEVLADGGYTYGEHSVPVWDTVLGEDISYLQMRCVCVRQWEVRGRVGVLVPFDETRVYEEILFSEDDSSDEMEFASLSGDTSPR